LLRGYQNRFAFTENCGWITSKPYLIDKLRFSRVRQFRVFRSVLTTARERSSLDHAATPPGQPGYQSVLSQLTLAVTGRGVFYFITIAAVLTVLALSANTSFADFRRLCRAIAEDRWLPDLFTIRGRRLVFSFGVYVLTFLAASLLIGFEGVTDRLIPLFAVGAFMAFTLSQAGMVMHWRRTGGRGAFSSMLINGVGALTTGCTTCVVIVAKFTEGAWITVLAIPGLVWLMSAVHQHYERNRA
jgi:amino acid transporter